MSRKQHEGPATRTGRLVALAVVVALTATGCIPAGAPASAPPLELYTGELPRPAELPASGLAGWSPSGMPAFPEPPADLTDPAVAAAYEAAVAEFLAQVEEFTAGHGESGTGDPGDPVAFAEAVGRLAEATTRSDAESVAAWQSLLVAAGIAVGEGSAAVTVNGSTGSGIPMTQGELRLHALMSAAGTGMPLTELAHVLEGIDAFAHLDLAPVLYDSLRNGLGTDFGLVFVAVGPDVFGGADVRPVEEVVLTAAQVGLLLRRLSAELLEHGAAGGGAAVGRAAAGIATAANDVRILPASQQRPAAGGAARACEPEGEPWSVEGRTQGRKLQGWLFGKVVDGTPLELGYKAAAALGTLATLAAKAFVVDAAFAMPGNGPLVRTKNERPGEARNLQVYVRVDPLPLAEMRECFSTMLEAIGLEFPGDTKTTLEGADVDFKVLNPQSAPIRLGSGSGSASYRGKTDAQGRVEFVVSGAPQKTTLPDEVEPDEVIAPVRADVNLEGSDLFKDLAAAGWDRLGGPLSVMAGLLTRWKLITFTWPVPVRDWTATAQFEVSVVGSLGSRLDRNTMSSGCGEVNSDSVTTKADALVSSHSPARVSATLLVDGRRDGVLFQAVDSEQPPGYADADGAALFEMAVQYEAEKSEHRPGLEPRPPLHEFPADGVCADGGGNYSDPSPDCGARDYWTTLSVNARDAAFHLTSPRDIDHQWRACGTRLSPSEPIAAPRSIAACRSPELAGGGIPRPDVVFDPDVDRFEVSGTMACSTSSEGMREQFDFEWTLVFCRVVEEVPAC